MQEVRLAIIGAGGIAQTHAHALEGVPQVRVTTVVDIIRERAESLADRLHADQVYEDIDEDEEIVETTDGSFFSSLFKERKEKNANIKTNDDEEEKEEISYEEPYNNEEARYVEEDVEIEPNESDEDVNYVDEAPKEKKSDKTSFMKKVFKNLFE